MKKLRLMGSGNTKRSRSLAQDGSAEVVAKGKPHKSENEKQETKKITQDAPEKTKSRSSRQSAENVLKEQASNPKVQQETKLMIPKDDLEKANAKSSRQSAEITGIADPTSLLSTEAVIGARNQYDSGFVAVLDGSKQVHSDTLERTRERLATRGYADNKNLLEHSALSPNLVDEFISVYTSLKQIKKGLGKEYYYSKAGIYRPMDNISDSYNKPRVNRPALKIALGDFLADSGFADVMKDAILKLKADFPNILTYDRAVEMRSISSADDSNAEVKEAQDFLSLTVLCSINYTDFCDAMNLAFNEAGLVQILVDIVDKLKDCTEHHVKYMDSDSTLTKKTVRGIILSRVMGTLHNLSKRVPTRANFHACNAVEVVLPMIDDKVPLYATKALLLLAYLIDEENNHLIMANEGPIKYLVSLIDKANNRSNQRYLGFSNSELAEGLGQIAINDSNKKTIVANGAIPVLTRMIRGTNSKEAETAAAEALWVLAFDDENKEKIKSNQQCMEALKLLKQGNNEKAKRAVSGVMWEIEGKQLHSKKKQQKQQQKQQQQQQQPQQQEQERSKQKKRSSKSSKSTDTAPYATEDDEEESATTDATTDGATTNHVMISYNWDNYVKKTMIQVKDRLQAAGYRVWMDIEQMGGSTLEAMANAVENSAVVLVCVSQKYYESSNCRSEAEYAFQLKKPVIPLMMQYNYQAKGWLGMVVGAKLWIDFSENHSRLDTSMKGLLKELKGRGKGDAEIVQVKSVDVVDAKPEPTIDISGWTYDDVINWMKGFGVVFKKKNPRVAEKLTGPVLTRLHSLRNECPEFYFSTLKDDIGLCDVFDVMLFTDELEKLVA